MLSFSRDFFFFFFFLVKSCVAWLIISHNTIRKNKICTHSVEGQGNVERGSTGYQVTALRTLLREGPDREAGGFQSSVHVLLPSPGTGPQASLCLQIPQSGKHPASTLASQCY